MLRGSVKEISENPASKIGRFWQKPSMRPQEIQPMPEKSDGSRSVPDGGSLFSAGSIRLSTGPIHTVKPLEVEIPKGKLTVVTGVSGSGKTTLILESLIPGLEALIHRQPLPGHIRALDAGGHFPR